MSDNTSIAGSSFVSTPPTSATSSNGSSKRSKKFFKNLFSHHDEHGERPGRTRSSTTSSEFYHGDEELSSEDEKSIDLNSYSAAIAPLCFKQRNKPTGKKSIPTDLTEKLQIIDDEDFEKYLTQPKYIKNFRKCAKCAPICKRLFLAQELDQNSTKGFAASTPDLVINDFVKSDGFSPNNTNTDYVDPLHDDKKHSIWTMKFSPDGKYLASAGRGNIIKIWKVIASPLDRLEHGSNVTGVEMDDLENVTVDEETKKTMYASVFQEQPYRIFEGHSHDILSLDWSKNNFLLSGSMDKTVKLWNVNQTTCLRTYTHHDFVTSVKFHPTDDRFFLSGCLDHKVRLWSILDNEVSYEFDAKNLVTAVTFTPNGNLTIAGTFNGTLYFLDTTNLELRHSLVINQKKNHANGSKVTGIETFFDQDDVKVLITTNDSRIRLLSLRQRQMVEYFKGLENNSSQIIATVSDDKKYVISGSENHWVYIWKLEKEEGDDNHHAGNQLKKLIHDKKKRKDYTSFHAHHSVVTCALVAPSATSKALSLSNDYIYELNNEFSKLRGDQEGYTEEETSLIKEDFIGGIIVTADDNGLIRVFRQDFSSTVRKMLIEEKNKKNKQENEHRIFLHKGLNRSNSSSFSKGNSFRNRNNNNNSSLNLSTSDLTSGNAGGGRSRSGTLDSNKNMNIAGLNQQLNGTAGHLVCEVCNSEKFKVSKIPHSREIGIFCTDCGNQLLNT